ncbi:hypothetical protein [Streptomyces sp. NPDC002520]
MRRTLPTPLLALALTGCLFLGQDTTCTEADADSQVAAVWRPADFGRTERGEDPVVRGRHLRGADIRQP